MASAVAQFQVEQGTKRYRAGYWKTDAAGGYIDALSRPALIRSAANNLVDNFGLANIADAGTPFGFLGQRCQIEQLPIRFAQVRGKRAIQRPLSVLRGIDADHTSQHGGFATFRVGRQVNPDQIAGLNV